MRLTTCTNSLRMQCSLLERNRQARDNRQGSVNRLCGHAEFFAALTYLRAVAVNNDEQLQRDVLRSGSVA
jgi:hypothetical protein